MGDRANVIVKQGDGDPPVVIYSHSGGSALIEGGLHRAITDAEGRAGDPHYFTALLIESLFTAGLVSGVGTSLDDNQYPVMVVDADTGKREEDIEEDVARNFLQGWRSEL